MKNGIPVSSIAFAAVNWGQHEAKRLVRFKEIGGGVERDSISGVELSRPITDRSYWEGRYVLCELRLELEGGEGMTFADAVASVSRQKRIVSTAVTGRDGTVKEYINAEDWQISIVLGIQSEENGEISDEWPGDELRRLRKLLDAPESLMVYSEFLDVFNIGRMVVKSYRATQMTEANYQTVEISAESDDEYEIFSKDYEQPKEDREERGEI